MRKAFLKVNVVINGMDRGGVSQ